MTSEQIVIKPQEGPQRQFLSSSADIVLYGGAAGGGKTWALLLEPLRHIGNPRFDAVVFRRMFAQVANPGGLWDASTRIYPHLGGKPRLTDRSWRFPSMARVRYGHLHYEQNVYDWQGSEIALLEWDELTHFSEPMFFYMLSRNRSLAGVRPYVRATTNPDADSWVAGFIDWWIDPSGYPDPDRAGIVRYFARINGVIEWADTPEELTGKHDSIIPKSFTFIPSSVYDNRILMEQDPGYLANLLSQTTVEMERLLKGNWRVRADAGKVFNRSWFLIRQETPRHGVMCRAFDFAASTRQLEGDDPDYTATVLMTRADDGRYYVIHASQERIAPADQEDMVMRLVRSDYDMAQRWGNPYMVRWEIEPGSAGLRENWRLATLLDRFDAEGIRPEGDKLVRAKPYASSAKVGNVVLLDAGWNEEYLQHLHHQPDWPHDDLMDASSIAYNALAWAGTDEALANAFGWS